VFSGTIADDTGEIQYSAWNDFGIIADKSYRINNAYIRSWKGIPQLNLGDNSEVSVVDVVFDTSNAGQGNERTVGDISKNGGGMDVIIRGVVVDIRPGSGMIKRCPQCNRTIINNECKTHGTVEPVPDLRMRIIVDDGTGSIATTMNREFTEKFTGVSFEAASQLSKARGEDIVVKDLGDRLYMKHLKIRGNAMKDEYGLKINAKDIMSDDVDVKKGAKELLDEVEGML
jgi:replication factor A1